jgi:outer membrane scaffolding protein for murein synthesis (MipA/OmpV family)
VRLAPLIALPVLLVATPAVAQDTPPAPAPTVIDPNADQVTLGAGAVYLPDYEGSDHYVFRAVPGAIGSIGGFAFQLAGNRFSMDLIPDKPGPNFDVQAGPVVVYDLNRSSLSGISDTRVRALGKRSASIEAGGYVGIGKTGVITSPYDKLSVSVSWRKGVTGANRGEIIEPSINYLTPLSTRAAIALFASAERVNRRYASTYFDVDAAGSVASGLPVFATRGGWKSWAVGGLATVSLTGDLSRGLKLVAGGTYRKLLNDFADSPIVSIAGSRSQWLGATGLAYTF